MEEIKEKEEVNKADMDMEQGGIVQEVESTAKPQEIGEVGKKKQKVDETLTEPKEISGYEKLLKLKRKSGIVFLNYQEDHMIIEHKEKAKADVSGSSQSQGQIDVKPNKKRSSSSISSKVEPVSGHSTSEKKPKPSTSRQARKRPRRRSKRNVISSSSSGSEYETWSVKNMRIDTSKPKGEILVFKIKLGIPKLSYSEKSFVKKGHCFRLKNYNQGRRVALKILSSKLTKKWKPPVSAWTGFSEEKRREKQLRLQKLTGNMKNITRTIPLALTRPFQNISEQERSIVSERHLFLLRNVNRTRRFIRSRLFWTKEAPKKRRLAQIPRKIFDPKDDKLSNYFPVSEIPEETNDQKIQAFATIKSVFKGCLYPTLF